MNANNAQIQTALLMTIGDSDEYPAGLMIWHMTDHYAAIEAKVKNRVPDGIPVSHESINRALWSLVRRGLVYISFTESTPTQWRIRLTESGESALDEEAESPENSDLFLDRLKRKVPDASDIVLQYVGEAITAYRNQCDLASTVMIGVASEAAFLEMARSFDKWLGDAPNSEGKKLRTAINDPRISIKPTFDAFRDAFDANRSKVPHGLKDGIETDFLAVFTLLRIYRNDAGHPAETVIDHEDVSNHLRMLPRYLQRLYDLRKHFDPRAQAGTD